MNKKEKIIYIIIRVLLGIIFIPNALIAFFIKPNQMGLNAGTLTVLQNLWDTGYIMHAAKFIELIVGIMFLTNRYVRLACILIMPVMINIVLLGAFKDPRALSFSVPLFGMIVYIAMQHIADYKYVLKSKQL